MILKTLEYYPKKDIKKAYYIRFAEVKELEISIQIIRFNMMPNGRRTGSVGTVSSFDLEPNPFEQSFASTKKEPVDGINSGEERSVGAGASASISASAGTVARGIDDTDVKRSSSMNYIGDVDAGSPGSGSMQRSNVPRQDPQVADQRRPSPLLFGNQRTTSVQSPPILTPGGSKKLPPLLMSPTFLTNQQSNGQMPNNGTGTQTPSGGAVQTNETDAQLPGFLMNLFKSGLTPNESNLRANFTPSILANIPSLGANSIGMSRASSNANILSNTGDKLQDGGPKMNGQIDISNKTLTSLGGLPAGQLTPGLSSLLAGSGQSLTNQVGGKSNGYFSVADNKKNDNDDDDDDDNNNVLKNNSNNNSNSNPGDKDKTIPKKRGRKKGVTNKNVENKKSKVTANANPDSQISQINTDSAVATVGQVGLHNDTYNSSVAGGSEDPNISVAEQERRRQEFLERNRVAASRFRRKKKEYIKRIEADVSFYQGEYDEMSRIIGSLAGITPEGSGANIQGSMLLMIEQALLNNDFKAAMRILETTKQIIASSGFVKRNGSNPRHESMNQDSD